jgi:hypothetical protein
MNSKFKAALAACAICAATGGIILAGAGSASAQGTPPPWVPGGVNQDQNAVGGLAFFDASGAPVTGGSLTDSPLAKYVVGLVKPRTINDTKATLYGFVPVPGQTPDQWSTNEQLGVSSNYPVTTAPAPINTTSLPVNTGGSSDVSVGTLQSDLPNTATTAGYANTYEIRMYTNSAGQSPSVTYDYADISINSSTNSWSLVYTPDATGGTATTSTLADGGVTAVNQGDTVTLTDTIAPSADGTVQFMNGASAIGSPVTVTGGVATTTAALTTAGTAKITAVFTPAGLSGFAGSTSNELDITVTHQVSNTTVAVSVNPTSAAAFSPVVLSANVTPNNIAGTVQFFDGGQLIAGSTSTVASGVATFTDSNFAAGTHHVTAIFTPTDTADFNTSAPSDPVDFVATPATGPAPDPQSIQTTVQPGSLAITTPYTAANPLVLPNMTLNADGTQLTTSAQFGDKSTDGSIKVVDTNPGSSWTASALSSNLSDGATPTDHEINGQNTGLTGLTGVYTAGNALQAGSVVLTDVPASTTVVAANDPGSNGLGGTTAHAFATANPGVGTVGIYGTLTVNAPSSTVPGTYTGTITFTVA